MTGWSAEYRERVYNADVPALLAHVDHLAAENARLREGVEGMVADIQATTTRVYIGDVTSSLTALLNPPTEGDDHE